MVGNTSRVVIFALLFATQTFACSDDDESGGAAVESGTCDSAATDYQCTEAKGDAEGVEFEKDDCDFFGGTWTTGPCPTAGLIGCCNTEFARTELRDCYYTGYIDPNPEETCLLMDGTWTPAGP